MNKTNKVLLGLGTLALILGFSGAIASKANAYKEDPSVKGPNHSTERHTAMEKAFKINDYTAWKALMQNQGRVTQIINKDNFAKFAEAHKLAESGNVLGAQKIRQELGLGLKDGSGKNMRNGTGQRTGKGNCMN